MNRQVRPALEGESEAQRKLLRYFAVYIRSCARKFFLAEEDRQDLQQEGQIALFRAIERYREARGPFGPYARLVIRRHINRAAEKMIHRNAVERARDLSEDIGEMTNFRQIGDPETEVMERERFRELETQMRNKLTDLESGVLAMFLQGHTYREIGRRLKKPTKSIDNALRRIRVKIKTA